MLQAEYHAVSVWEFPLQVLFIRFTAYAIEHICKFKKKTLIDFV